MGSVVAFGWLVLSALDRVGWVLALAEVLLLCPAMGCRVIGELVQENVTYSPLLRLEKTKIQKMLKLRRKLSSGKTKG